MKVKKLPILIAVQEQQTTDNGQKEKELERFKKLIEGSEIITTWPEDPLRHEIKQIILETIFKFAPEGDGAWHNNRLNSKGEVEEITVKMEDHFGRVFIPWEVKIKRKVGVPIVRGRLFDQKRPYIKLQVVVKFPPRKIGKKFFRSQSSRVILYDLQKGGPAKIISISDQK